MKRVRKKNKNRNYGKLKYSAATIGLMIFFVIGVPAFIVIFFGPEVAVIEKEPPPPPVSNEKVKVYIQSKDSIDELYFEEYIKSVVASEMPATFEEEALKAQAVAARTYAKAKIERFNGDPNAVGHSGAPLCDQVHCQVYRSKEDIEKLKTKKWMDDYWEKISNAVDSTSGQVMKYNGALAGQALFHSSSGGKTENSEDVFTSAVPYLRSVVSSYEQEAPHNKDQASFLISDVVKKIKTKYPSANVNDQSITQMKVVTRSSGDRVEMLKIGDLSLSGRSLREILGLRSANFTFAISGNQVIFTTVGYGHGVGMSQWGANGMAQEGYKYDEIIKHYYQGVVIESYL